MIYGEDYCPKSTILNQNLLATSVLIWRMYYLWKGKHWVCVIPSVALVIWVGESEAYAFRE